jgi:hypothetical protein
MAAQKSHDYTNTSRMFGADGCRYAMSSLRYEILYSGKARINTSISVSSDLLTPPTRCMFEYGDKCPRACPTPLEASDGGTYRLESRGTGDFFPICPRTDQIQLRAKVAKISTKLVNLAAHRRVRGDAMQRCNLQIL